MAPLSRLRLHWSATDEHSGERRCHVRTQDDRSSGGRDVLYDMTEGSLARVERTSFARENILERTHLQAAVRDHIEVLGTDLLVVSEEFGSFEDAHRRIDLLCLDQTGRLVVVELKRTDDGGHMELQALRYAAMVSVMTFDDVVVAYRDHLNRHSPEDVDEATARSQLAEFLDSTTDDLEEGEAALSREVRIILVAADFSTEITTTVLWLTELYQLEIRCVRLTPYRLDDRVLLDVQQVVPLPEAEELMVRIRRREAAAREARTHNHDLTKYAIRSPTGVTEPLPKRRAVLSLIAALHHGGVPGEALARVVPNRRLISVPGRLTGEELWRAMAEVHSTEPQRRRRWFIDHPVHDRDRTWVLFNNWGLNTEPTLNALLELAPSNEYGYDASL